MRSLWLASTALLLTTGIAFAQSTQMSSPAPTGAISAPQTTPTGTAAGNMGTGGVATPDASGIATNSGMGSQAPNGAASAPNLTTGAAPGTAPGKFTQSPPMSPAMASASSEPMSGSMHHHHWMTGALPQDASADTYLHIAKSAITHHNGMLADDALSHAETRLLNRAVPQGDIAADDSAPIQSIESARQALHSGNYSKASMDTKQAASAVSGM